jgi:hypothetical protein
MGKLHTRTEKLRKKIFFAKKNGLGVGGNNPREQPQKRTYLPKLTAKTHILRRCFFIIVP